jgi:hypothetical protein
MEAESSDTKTGTLKNSMISKTMHAMAITLTLMRLPPFPSIPAG